MNLGLTEDVPRDVTTNSDEVLFITPERNLLTMGFFSPTKRDLRNRKEKHIETEIEIDGKRTTVSVTILPSAKYGLPTTADLDKYMALLMIAGNKSPSEPIPNPIYFRGQEMLRYLGLKDSGTNYRHIDDWMYRMFTTSIRSKSYIYHARRAMWISDTVHVFERVLCAGQPLPTEFIGRREGEKSEHYIVWLPDWHRDNLTDSYAVRLAYNAYIDLKSPLAKTLLTICAASTKSQNDVVELQYQQICQIADLNELKYKSLIEKQLANAVEELLKTSCINNWELLQENKRYKIKFHLGARILYGQLPAQHRNQMAQASQMSPETLTPEMLINALVERFGVAHSRAKQLVHTKPDSVRRQLDYFVARNVKPRNLAGWIIRAIEADYPPPAAPQTVPEAKHEAKNEVKENTPKSCDLCKEWGGFRYVVRDGRSGVRRCTHNPEIEKNYP